MKILSRILCRALIVTLLIPDTFAMAGNGTETAGDLLSLLTPTAAYATTFWRMDREGRKQFEKSFLSSVATTYGLKAVIDHHGPNGESHSFPSGHSTLAFAGASFLQQRYGWQYGLPALLAAGFVGYSRVESEDHQWIDVASGAGISIVATLYFVSPYEKKVVLAPFVDKETIGLSLKGDW